MKDTEETAASVALLKKVISDPIISSRLKMEMKLHQHYDTPVRAPECKLGRDDDVLIRNHKWFLSENP
ncbi:hypothetical protein NFI96_002976 [Prochilodus magdalenae]|nr:hypothetical protein NFI96_002976 [Prochilodus magdalenae]